MSAGPTVDSPPWIDRIPNSDVLTPEDLLFLGPANTEAFNAYLKSKQEVSRDYEQQRNNIRSGPSGQIPRRG